MESNGGEREMRRSMPLKAEVPVRTGHRHCHGISGDTGMAKTGKIRRGYSSRRGYIAQTFRSMTPFSSSRR